MIIYWKQLNNLDWNPVYWHPGDSGVDLCSSIDAVVFPFIPVTIPTGIGLELPFGIEGQIRPRSGLASKGLLASFGTLDSEYRGPVKVVLFNLTLLPKIIHTGDRIAQLVISSVRQAFFKKSTDLSISDRGDKGFGSTGIR